MAQGASDAEGTAIISDVLLLGDSITISMTDVPVLGDGLAYEGWLVPDDGPPAFSLGIMDVDGNGSINHTFVSEDGDNLINTYNKFVISIERYPTMTRLRLPISHISTRFLSRPWRISGTYSLTGL